MWLSVAFLKARASFSAAVTWRRGEIGACMGRHLPVPLLHSQIALNKVDAFAFHGANGLQHAFEEATRSCAFISYCSGAMHFR